MTKFINAEKELESREIPWDSCILKELPPWLKKAYLKDIDYCEHLDCKNKNLEVHRIKRGNEGGLYSPDNIKILCRKHHNFYHSNEYNNCKSK